MRTFLLWDHDGVLVDTERWYFRATQQSLGALGVELECAIVRNDFTATQDFTGAWRVLDSVKDLPRALAG